MRAIDQGADPGRDPVRTLLASGHDKWSSDSDVRVGLLLV